MVKRGIPGWSKRAIGLRCDKIKKNHGIIGETHVGESIVHVEVRNEQVTVDESCGCDPCGE